MRYYINELKNVKIWVEEFDKEFEETKTKYGILKAMEDYKFNIETLMLSVKEFYPKFNIKFFDVLLANSIAI